MNKKIKLGVKILLSPFVLLALSFLMFAITRLFSDNSATDPTSINIAVNLFLFLFGTLSVVSFFQQQLLG